MIIDDGGCVCVAATAENVVTTEASVNQQTSAADSDSSTVTNEGSH